ncbi:hypothetical protein RND81_05G230500 [Saponaria officinalis]
MQMEMPDEKKQFTCSGTITEIRTDVEWRYLSCPTCKCGFNAEGKCRQCNKTTDYPIQRYRIMMTLSDETATANLVLFNKEAERVVGKLIEKLLDVYEKENGKEQVYELLQECVGKKYTFKVKVGESKYNGERELKGQKNIIVPKSSYKDKHKCKGRKTAAGDNTTNHRNNTRRERKKEKHRRRKRNKGR